MTTFLTLGFKILYFACFGWNVTSKENTFNERRPLVASGLMIANSKKIFQWQLRALPKTFSCMRYRFDKTSSKEWWLFYATNILLDISSTRLPGTTLQAKGLLCRLTSWNCLIFAVGLHCLLPDCTGLRCVGTWNEEEEGNVKKPHQLGLLDTHLANKT